MKAYTVTGNKASWISQHDSLYAYIGFLIVYPGGKGKYKIWKLTVKSIASQYFTERNIVEMNVNSHERHQRHNDYRQTLLRAKIGISLNPKCRFCIMCLNLPWVYVYSSIC